MSDITTVTATEFKNSTGLFIEQAAKKPIAITKHGHPSRVLIDIDEYERLKARDTRRHYFVEELPDEWVEALEAADYSHLDSSMDDEIASDLRKQGIEAP